MWQRTEEIARGNHNSVFGHDCQFGWHLRRRHFPPLLLLHAITMYLILPTALSSSSASFSLFAAALSRSSRLRRSPVLLIRKPNSLSSCSFYSFPPSRRSPPSMSWLGKLGLGFGNRAGVSSMDASSAGIAQGPDDDVPTPGLLFAQFGAGCFWGVELTFQRIPGVTKTEVGYSQGLMHNPTYEDVCTGATNHSEVVRVQYDPNACQYDDLLDVFWARHDPTMLNRQGNDVGTQYRSGIYYYTPEQEKAAKESLEKHQKVLGKKVVTEILPAKKFYRAEEYHQQYLEKGGRFGSKQSASKGCTDPIRCYG